MKNLYTNRAWAEIDLDALGSNLRNIRKITNPDAKIMCVIKANAYGHGFYNVAKCMQENGADAFAVATFEEAKQLRNNGFTEPLLVLGYVDISLAEDMVALDISAAIYHHSFAKAMSDAGQKLKKQAHIHIKLDTGMTRIGFGCTEEDVEKIAEICSLPQIHTEGIFSHFSCADENNRTMPDLQFSRFTQMIDALKQKGIHFDYSHICNSAGIMEYPEFHLDMVRPGIILYGQYPSDVVHKERLQLKPAMTLKARIVRVETVPKGTPVGYGATYVTTKETKIATVSIGYADGYFRTLSQKAYMYISGVRVPVVGRICMDQCMIDVSDVNTITVGDEVIVFGNGGNDSETAASIAKHAGTISYEILCAIGNRVPRLYVRNGEIIDVLTYL